MHYDLLGPNYYQANTPSPLVGYIIKKRHPLDVNVEVSSGNVPFHSSTHMGNSPRGRENDPRARESQPEAREESNDEEKPYFPVELNDKNSRRMN